ncbi:MAG TPA: hypothetical protein VEI03_12480 [Stellaceae bacterium]|nr:hypothetical protein [Stellaceae bacterium]
MHRLILCSAVALCVNGCTGLWPSSSLSANSLDYNAAIQDAGDKLLVINILRARDLAPLHFGDVPSIHETVQLTAGLTPTFIFGPVHPGSVSNSVAAAVSLQDAPTFEMDNLDTQDFVTGVMSPIEPKVVKYWLDRGMDQRIALLLFFSGVSVSLDQVAEAGPKDKKSKKEEKPVKKETVFVLNSPRAAVPVTDAERSQTPGDRYTRQGIAVDQSGRHKLPFLSYLSIIDWINDTGGLVPVASDDKTEVGPKVKIDKSNVDKYFKDFVHIDPEKYELDPAKDENGKELKDWYQLYALGDEKKITFCFAGAALKVRNLSRPSASSAKGDKAGDDDVCRDAGIESAEKAESDAGRQGPRCKSLAEWLESLGSKKCSVPADSIHFELRFRSAGDVVHFLGDLVYRQEHPFDLPPRVLNNPVTLAYCPPDGAAACDSGGALFVLGRDDAPGRFKVAYVDGTYTVANASEKDHTLEVLSILTQLIDLNKSAKDLRETPTVKIIP